VALKLSPAKRAATTSGELDIASAEIFEAELKNALQSDASAVLLDVGELSFIDSTGIRALLIAAGLSEANGRRLRVAARPP